MYTIDTITIDAVNSKCSYIGPDIANEAHGILTSITVLNGPPTNVECKIDNDVVSQSQMTIDISNSESPTSVTINSMSLVPFDTMGSASLICTVSNSAGSGTFTCNIQGKLYT